MQKKSLVLVLLSLIQVLHSSGQTGSKADMFGPSGLNTTFDKSIIINGDFSAEYSNWSFDQGTGGYHIRYDGISNPGDIQVGSNPAAFNKGSSHVPGFNSYGDHTTGFGNFLMVDGRCNSTYIKLWKQTVNIQPNTYYLFSIWISSLKDNPNHPGVLIFNIGGQSIGVTIVAPYKGGDKPNEGGGWVQFQKIWFSGTTSGNVLVSIENNNTETCDSEVDFGIDDIELKTIHKDKVKKPDSLKKTSDILFKTSSHSIDSAYFIFLNTLAKETIQNSAQKLYIKGYTDSQDDFESNLELSKRRSLAVKNYLISKGVPGNRIKTDGFGETLPVETNDTAEGREKNRRAEIYILVE